VKSSLQTCRNLPSLPLARQANVEGEVIVDVTVRQDGSAEATVLKGHPLLKQAALDSALQSRFECRLCSAPLSYRLVYTFKRTSEGSCCGGMGAPIRVEQEPQSYDEHGRPQTRVTISAEKICLCDPSFTVTKKVRSPKCLYLWSSPCPRLPEHQACTFSPGPQPSTCRAPRAGGCRLP
jgi:Gram-negative bacterial TonB protein C-terminal